VFVPKHLPPVFAGNSPQASKSLNIKVQNLKRYLRNILVQVKSLSFLVPGLNVQVRNEKIEAENLKIEVKNVYEDAKRLKKDVKSLGEDAFNVGVDVPSRGRQDGLGFPQNARLIIVRQFLFRIPWRLRGYLEHFHKRFDAVEHFWYRKEIHIVFNRKGKLLLKRLRAAAGLNPDPVPRTGHRKTIPVAPEKFKARSSVDRNGDEIRRSQRRGFYRTVVHQYRMPPVQEEQNHP
jgi:hypothetical protein